MNKNPLSQAQLTSTMVSSIDPQLQQLLNQSIRDQLTPKADIRTDKIALSLSALTQGLFDHLPHDELVSLFTDSFTELHALYQESELTEAEIETSYINATGLVMAVKDCINTVKDIYRVKAFVNGLHQAIEFANGKNNQDTLHIVYPACGPFAPLLLPLIAHYHTTNNNEHNTRQNRLKITLIDIQPGAIKVLQNLVSKMGIEEYIQDILCMDIMDYQPDHAIDILVMEAFQHGLSREGHLHFAHHLAKYLAEDAILLPEKLTVTAFLNSGQNEYCDQWEDQERAHSDFLSDASLSNRVTLGEVFSLDISTLKKMKAIPFGENFNLLEGQQVQIPHSEGLDKKALMLSATATIFNKENINEYDSGISHPKIDTSICINFKPKTPEPDDLLVNSGDRLKFYYKLTGAPGFIATLA
jgi:hypothetical protein